MLAASYFKDQTKFMSKLQMEAIPPEHSQIPTMEKFEDRPMSPDFKS